MLIVERLQAPPARSVNGNSRRQTSVVVPSKPRGRRRVREEGMGLAMGTRKDSSVGQVVLLVVRVYGMTVEATRRPAEVHHCSRRVEPGGLKTGP